jgi:hypothetical protein
LEAEVESGIVLKLERSLHSVRRAADSNVWGHESRYVEVFPKLLRVPHLSVLGFQRLSTSWLKIDFGDLLAADGFSWIVHVDLLS